MSSAVTYSSARAGLRALLDEVTSTREPIYIRRRGREDVAVLPADELRGLLEAAYLLRSPANAERLAAAFSELDTGGGAVMTVADLRHDVGLDER
jgi:antitoxin YefM